MYYNMKLYYDKIGKDIFQFLPHTFHVKGKDDKVFEEFEAYFREKQKAVVDELRNECNTGEPRTTYNIWIVKPGENSNRGSGIAIYDSFFDIRERIMES
jgi:tubulin--tyrosine ligase